jgi:hypothetical protein
MYLIALLLITDQQTSTLVKSIAYQLSLLSAILIIDKKKNIFLPTYP